MSKLERFLNILVVCVAGVFGGGLFLDYQKYQEDPAAFELAKGMSWNDHFMAQVVTAALIILIVLFIRYRIGRKKK